MTRAVGVLNGNYLNGAIYRYVQDVNAANRKAAVIAVCQDIRDMMTQEQYDAWWEAAPDENFLQHAQAKLADLQAEPVAPELASSLDVDPSAESCEIEEDMRVFGPAQLVEHPTYDQLIAGAKFTDQHRAEVRQKWNEMYSDEAVQARIRERGL